MARVMLLLGLSVLPIAAHADPITLVATLAPVIGGTAAAWVVSNAALIAVTGYGLFNAVTSRRKARQLASAQRQAALDGLSDRTTNILSAEAPWRVVYGRPAPVGCAIVAVLTSGANQDLRHMVCVFAAHECDAIEEVYLNGVAVGPLRSDGWATTGTFVGNATDVTGTVPLTFNADGYAYMAGIEVLEILAVSASLNLVVSVVSAAPEGSMLLSSIPGYTAAVTYRARTVRPYVNIQKHLSPGGVDTADALLMSLLPTQWTAQHRLSGFTYIVLSLDLSFQQFQSGPPTVTARLRGKKLYDYRTGETAFRRNPALCLADFLRADYGYGSTPEQIDIAQAVASANACDVAGYAVDNYADEYLFGASPAFYLCDGSFTTDQDRETTRQQIEDTMAGSSHESGGVWRIDAGAWSTPVMTLTDDDMLAPLEVSQACNTGAQRYNGARGTYINASGLGVSEDFPPYQNGSYLAADGRDKFQDLSLAFVGSSIRAQVLGCIKTEISRGGMVVKATPKMSAWRLQPGDRVTLTSGIYAFTNKNFRVQDWAFSTAAPVALQLVEDEPGYYDRWEDASTDQAPNTTLPDPFLPPAQPVFVDVKSGTAALARQGSTVIVRVFVQWQAAPFDVQQGGKVQLQWRYAAATEADWQPAELPGSATSSYLTGIEEGAAILLRDRFVNTLGVPGPWAIRVHTVVGKTEPPPQVDTVELSIDRVFFSEISRAVVPDLDGYLVRALPGTVAQWSLGVPLHTGLVTDSPWPYPQRLYGVQTVMVAAVDTSGNVGAPGWDTQDFGQPDVSQAIQVADLGTGTAAGDPSADYWAIGADFWVRDGASDFWGGSAYLPLALVGRFSPAYGGGNITLDVATTGSRTQVDYRFDGGTVGDFWAGADGQASADFWSGDGGYWGVLGDWQPWLGELVSVRGQGVLFRVSVAGGPQEGSVSVFRAHLVMPLVTQVFGEQVIGLGGTRLAPSAGQPARNWISITSVIPAVAADGGAAVTSRYRDRNPALGPLVELLDATGAAVAGRASAVVHGYEDATT
ncbi:hypothetical protein GT347_20355 [Xylophilus rhododendri]|uniref:Tip attachment protein J domain-containing protein n=1 Tax=Xylophilus rhododendri TaxID=2697032 RepID=A0A857J826_9BURK|nr:hypothetical protein [Xylophilus rhododendri]QHJ00125.1 hypothetical protein GT347_20355 [Xylophilus rhododendri]